MAVVPFASVKLVMLADTAGEPHIGGAMHGTDMCPGGKYDAELHACTATTKAEAARIAAKGARIVATTE